MLIICLSLDSYLSKKNLCDDSWALIDRLLNLCSSVRRETISAAAAFLSPWGTEMMLEFSYAGIRGNSYITAGSPQD